MFLYFWALASQVIKLTSALGSCGSKRTGPTTSGTPAQLVLAALRHGTPKVVHAAEAFSSREANDRLPATAALVHDLSYMPSTQVLAQNVRENKR